MGDDYLILHIIYFKLKKICIKDLLYCIFLQILIGRIFQFLSIMLLYIIFLQICNKLPIIFLIYYITINPQQYKVKKQKKQLSQHPFLHNNIVYKKMHKKVVNQKDKVVNLQQLISQPQCLKLLILHTPFTLNLSSLHQCINLVKLDLSRNNLIDFPYLGNLPNLKFMFIHQNKLEIDTFIGIFQEEIGKQTKSALSKSIVWVTYWGNKSQFNARHYLVNHTNVLAVDNHMVVEEERNQVINVNQKYIKPFDQITNVSEIFHARRKFNKNATQEEYMVEFWEDMAAIRKKHIQINPALKIQKVFRGWSYRIKKIRERQEEKQNKNILKQFFKAWSKQTKFDKKLTKIFQKKNKQYLLLPIRQMKIQAAKRKIIQFSQNCKKKVLLRKMSLMSQYKFYNVIKSNYYYLRGLYDALNIGKSNYVVIHVQGFQQFIKYVGPFLKSLHQGKDIQVLQNKSITVRSLFEQPKKKRQFLRLIQLNEKSVVFKRNLVEKQNQNKNPQNLYNYTLFRCQNDLKKSYGSVNTHFSKSQLEKMRLYSKQFEKREKLALAQLMIIKGSNLLLRDIVRGVYFYNMGYLTKCQIPQQKINVLSQYSIKRMSAILKIQKNWRGVTLRRKLKEAIKFQFTLQRAAIKIQRWFRKLPTNHRRVFMIYSSKSLKSFSYDSFYIRMSDYMSLVQSQQRQKETMNFLEQNILPFINKQNRKLTLSWNYQTSKEGIRINHKVGKKLFTQKFRRQIFDGQQFIQQVKQGQESKFQKCSISHLFHYGTQISILGRKQTKYLQVKCLSKYECRLRVLALRTLSYSFNHKSNIQIYPKQYLSLSQIQQTLKRPILNKSSIFISQNNSQFYIQPAANQKGETFQVVSRFYINAQQNAKPIRYHTTFRIILINTQNQQLKSPNRPVKSASYHQNFDLANFLIAETNEVRLSQNVQQLRLKEEIGSNIYQRAKKNSFKNINMERIKAKNRQKVHSGHLLEKQKFNFRLDNPYSQQKLTTQPDLLTHERSMGSIVMDKQQLAKSDKKSYQSRLVLNRKNIEQRKANIKNLDSFTKNFINQGNFIQNQFMYGQIKRLKTQIQRSSIDKVERVKTEQNEMQKNVARFNQQKVRLAQRNHQKHKDELYKSMMQKKVETQAKVRKSEPKQINYRSLPKRMRINFAQECYPIIGKRPIHQ